MQINGFVKKQLFSKGDFRTAIFLQKSPHVAEITVAGMFPEFDSDEEVELHGDWTTHPQYGDQFKVETGFRIQPKSLAGLQKYLAKGINGVGPKRAKQLIKKFGNNLVHVLNNNPKALTEIPGIGDAAASRIVEAWKADSAHRQIAMYLSELEVNPSWSKRIYKELGANAVERIKKNPYLLVEVAGIGFKRADEIAGKMGWEGDSPERAENVLVYVLEKAATEGHCYLERGAIFAQAEKDCKIKPEIAEIALDRLIKAGRLIRDNFEQGPHTAELIYTPRLYRSETGLAKALLRLMKTPVDLGGVSLQNLSMVVSQCEQDLGLELTDEQRSAVITALTSPVSVLTGGPGTGKTATLRVLVHAAKRLGFSLTLCAPTGRASKHMSSIVEEPAGTIHRMYGYDSENRIWARNVNNPLDTDITVMDESSMADIDLAYRVVDAQPPGKPLLFVGDKDQLPSVSAGRVLDDLISSKQVPVTILTQIFRQSANSNIIQNAYRILKGESMVFPQSNQMVLTDCYLQEPPEIPNPADLTRTMEDPEWIKTRLMLLCRDRIPARLGLNPIKDIQVLTPMKDGICGVHDLNKTLQEALNPIEPGLSKEQLEERQLLWGNKDFRVDDRVLVTRNNYAINLPDGVFNGDVGIIHKIDREEKALQINFYDKMVQYPFENLDDLTHGYAMTIHKSQGSESKAVIVVMLKRNHIMLARNLLYTAATRAKSMLIFVGLRWVLKRATENVVIDKRNSYLAHRLRTMAEAEAEKELLAACPV